MNVRGVRNIPCETKPGKRAPTVELCESDEQYVPLNDGLNWKGDPNATLSGQGVPQYAPGQDPRLPPPQGTGAAAPVAAAPVSVMTPRPAITSARTESGIHRPIWRIPATRPGSRCWCRRRPSAPLSSRAALLEIALRVVVSAISQPWMQCCR